MFSVSDREYQVPMFKGIDSVTKEAIWAIIRTPTDGKTMMRSFREMITYVGELHYTAAVELLLKKDGAWVIERERVTFLLNKQGHVKPLPRSLRVLGSQRISSLLQKMFVDGDPTKGVASESYSDYVFKHVFGPCDNYVKKEDCKEYLEAVSALENLQLKA